AVEAPPILPVPRQGSLPLSFAQQRLWFLHRLAPDSAAYNVPLTVGLSGRLDAAALAAALHEIGRRHEVLRTTFAERQGRPFQVIAPEPRLPLPLLDLSGLPAAEREAEVLRRALTEALAPFDLAAGPLVRAALLRLGEEDHALLVTMHHIVTDGWSRGIFLRELTALYAGHRLPELPVQYGDFAVWQRAWLSGGVLETQISYWRQRLAGAPARLALPADRTRPAVATDRGELRPVALSPELSRSLTALARSEGATPFMVLLAGFAALLGRYSGQDDVVVGTPVAGRNRREVEGLIGFFVNNLALRVELADGLGFVDLLRQVRRTALDAYAHQDIPFERLVEEVVAERGGLDHSPLFQVTLAVQNTPVVGDGVVPGLELRRVTAEPVAAKFELSLVFALLGEELAGGLEYNTDLFDATTADRLARHFARLLEVAMAAPEMAWPELPLLDRSEAQQVLLEWNDTEAAYPGSGSCLHELVFEQAERTPEAVAVVAGEEGEEHLTHAELRRRAGWLAHRLRRLGVAPEVPVALCAERSLEMVVGLLGILEAGGAYVPLDPDYPAERLAYMVEDSAAALLLAQRHHTDRLPENGTRILFLDELACPEAGAPPAMPDGATPDNLLYVIYTSGSTGRPKGVMVRHRGVVNRLLWAAHAYPVTAADRVLQKAPFSFDFSVWECFGALLSGARLVLARPGGQRDGAYLARTVVEQGITLLHFVPAMLQAFLEEEGLESCHSLRFIFSGGDALTSETVERFQVRMPAGVLLRNQYGPTEISIDVTEWVCREERTGSTPPIGKPLGNGRVYVIGPNGELVPAGVPGELLLGGVGVARGYRGRPDLTAERFVPSPWGDEAGARLYRTGDRVRQLADGNLEFLGRVDHQVKIRGYRIEPGEIEAVLALHPAVREAAVVVRQDAAGLRSLLACVVPVPLPGTAAVTTEELRAAMRGSLPDYMVPGAFALLEELPLTPSGKVDRKALEKLAPARDERAAEPAAIRPRTPSEEILAAIFAEVLRHERVGLHDGFFDLGGHSLLATQVVSRVRQAFGVELPVRELFEAPTVAGLAERIERLRRARSELAVVPVPRVPGEQGGLPLSFAQQRLWFLHRLAPDSAVYNVPMAVRLSGRLDAAALAGALREIGRRHEALRTTFSELQGHPVQVIDPEPRLTLMTVGLADLPPSEREAEVLRRALAEALAPFDLAAGPLVRATLLRLGAEEHALLVTMHHIVTDAWSMGIFLRELTTLYGAFVQDRPSPLPELPIQYGDFAAWQRIWLSGEVLESQISYWRERLSGVPVRLNLHTDRPRPAVETHRGASLPVVLPLELSRSLTTLARREGATPFMVLLAGFAALLGRYSGQDDVVVGSPIAGRNRREIEGLIGFFVNTLALRVELADGLGFMELVRQVRQTALDAYAHQDIPFERLVEELVTERDLSHSPLFQAVLTLQNASVITEGGGVPGLELRPVEVAPGTAKFELSLGFTLRGEELAGSLEYNTDLFDTATVERLARHLARLLEGATASPGVWLAELPLLDESERRQLLQEWGQGLATPATDRPVHRLVAARAAEAPEAVALVSAAGHAVTYGELSRRAAGLAHRLRALGVGPEERVGVLLDRSPEEVTSLLAVLLAGGAYVPLDPTWPRERVGLVIEDAGVRVVLTTSERGDLLPGPSPLLLDRVWDEAGSATSGPPAEVDHLAYVIYTSGSTGRPKGVEITHRSLLRLLAWHQRAFAVTAADRATRLSGLAFDAAVWELWPYLVSGASVHVPDEESRTSPPALREWLLAQGITIGFVSTPVAEALLPISWPAYTPLRVLLTGGDRLHRDPGPLPFTLVNNYGPTESTVVATSGAVQPQGAGRAPDIGQPVDGTRVLLLDRELRLVPPGVAGEICIGGPGLARGYLG
ncbi:MAG TPA: amino acid adenylation domain-containing protein, partial [Thermoanaerobaculia bacterium]|nr:amino acid adenylation domain-containing protein [Thermoanaerobaculia bacterium]